MKQKLSGFLTGVLTTVIIGSLTITALATSGKLTIDVYPINVQVNGATFQPKDVSGNDVPVFNAPLRALAEAYGLEVGYDAEKNMATVGKQGGENGTTAPSTDYSDWTAEEEAAYQEFLSHFNITSGFYDNPGEAIYGTTCMYREDNQKPHDEFAQSIGIERYKCYAQRVMDETVEKATPLYKDWSGPIAVSTSFRFVNAASGYGNAFSSIQSRDTWSDSPVVGYYGELWN